MFNQNTMQTLTVIASALKFELWKTEADLDFAGDQITELNYAYEVMGDDSAWDRLIDAQFELQQLTYKKGSLERMINALAVFNDELDNFNDWLNA